MHSSRFLVHEKTFQRCICFSLAAPGCLLILLLILLSSYGVLKTNPPRTVIEPAAAVIVDWPQGTVSVAVRKLYKQLALQGSLTCFSSLRVLGFSVPSRSVCMHYESLSGNSRPAHSIHLTVHQPFTVARTPLNETPQTHRGVCLCRCVARLENFFETSFVCRNRLGKVGSVCGVHTYGQSHVVWFAQCDDTF